MANDAGPEAKRWAVAGAAILNTMTRHQPRHDRLGGAEKRPQPEPTAVTVLANSWGIQNRDQLVACLEGLASAGNSRDYQQAAAAFQAAPPQQRAQDPNLAFVNQFGQEIGNRGLLAWDLGRMLAVAGWGYLAGLCSEDEAWNACLSAGQRLRGAYRSWEEYGHHYRLGVLFWDAASVGQLDQILGQLAAPNSPWKTLPWSLDGAGALPGFPPVAGAQPGGPPGYGPPPGAIAPPGGGAPGYGPPPGAIAPPGGGGPGGYGPPPGAPGAPASYGGVPVIAPPPGGAGPMPGGPPMPGAPGKGGGKGLILAILGVGGLLFFILLVVVVMHFRHKSEEAAHDGPRDTPHEPAKPREGKHGKH